MNKDISFGELNENQMKEYANNLEMHKFKSGMLHSIKPFQTPPSSPTRRLNEEDKQPEKSIKKPVEEAQISVQNIYEKIDFKSDNENIDFSNINPKEQ